MPEALAQAFAAAGRGSPCVLVKSPQAGSWMLVLSEGSVGSLGGGPIEERAIAHARSLLARLTSPMQESIVDTIELGVGEDPAGTVTLVFEALRPVGASTLEEWRRSARELVQGSATSLQAREQPEETAE